jgi:hypothetical protein
LSQKIEWAKSVGGASADTGSSIAIDNEGNSYIIGHFGSTVDFDPGPDIFELTDIGANKDAYILKLDNEGEFIWAKSIESESIFYAKQINIDADGNLYITGYFYGEPDFDPGIGTHIISAGESVDSYLLKLNSDGDFIWVKTYGLTHGCYARHSIIDQVGNIYTCGYYNDTLDIDPGPEDSLIYSNGLNDCFIQKLNNDGEFIWGISLGDTGYESSKCLSIDSEGNLYIIGAFQGTVDFDPGPSEYNVTALDPYETFILKLTSEGEFLWVGFFYCTDSGSIVSIDFDQFDNIYMTGRFNETMDFDPSEDVHEITSSAYYGSVFIGKITSAGEFLWVKSWDKPETWSKANQIKIDNNNNNDIYIAGEISSNGDLDPGPTTHNCVSPDNHSIGFIEKLDSAGNFNWAKTFVSVADYAGYGNSIRSLRVDTIGQVYVTGFHKGSLGFDPIYEIDSLSVHGGSYSDVLTAKITPCEMEFGDTLSIYYCDLDSFYWESNHLYLKESGFYSHSHLNIYGCDSMVYLDLNLNESYMSAFDTTVCSAFLIPSNDSIVSESGAYNDTLTSIYGCDSIITYNVTVNNSFSELIAMVCDSFISPSGLIIYESGVYLDTIPNHLGCDSIITCNVSVNNSFSELFPTACDSFISPSGLILDESGVYFDTIPNHLGCDSVITIDLTLEESFYDSSLVIACTEYLWDVNDETYTTSGTFEEFYVTTEGCDSVYYLNLVINNINTDVTQSDITLMAVNPDADYQWLDCENDYAVIPGATNQTYISEMNGSFAVQISEEGCSDTSECLVISEVGISNYSIKPTILVYPNPSSGFLFVEIDSNNDRTEIKLFNFLGELMLTKSAYNSKRTELNTHFLPPGIYYLEIWINDSLSKTEKVVFN